MKIFILIVSLCILGYAANKDSTLNISSKNSNIVSSNDSLLKESNQIIDSTKSNKPLEVIIKEVPQTESFLLGIIKVLIPTLFGGFILWWFQKNYQDKKDKQKRFENTFFIQLDRQNRILNDFEIEIKQGGQNKSYKGVNLFNHITSLLKSLDKLQYTFSRTDVITNQQILCDSIITQSDIIDFYNFSPASKYHERSEIDSNGELIKKMSIHAYNLIYEKFNEQLDQYYGSLFNLLNFIKKEEPNIHKYGVNPLFYSNLIQDRMSKSELILLFYDGLRNPKLGNYIDEFRMIENLSEGDLIHNQQNGFYKTAFKIID